jgi:hypothetical protein
VRDGWITRPPRAEEEQNWSPRRYEAIVRIAAIVGTLRDRATDNAHDFTRNHLRHVAADLLGRQQPASTCTSGAMVAPLRRALNIRSCR